MGRGTTRTGSVVFGLSAAVGVALGVSPPAAVTAEERAWWSWALAPASGAGGYSEAMTVVVLSDGTSVVAGTMDGTTYFPTGRPAPDDSIAVVSSGATIDMFVAGVDSTGAGFTWAQRAGGVASGTVVPYGVASANDGTVLITGTLTGTAYFPTGRSAPDDSIALTATGASSAFIATVDLARQSFAWVQPIGGVPRALAVAAGGATVVVGSFVGQASFPKSSAMDDSITVSSRGGSVDGFVAVTNADDSYFAWVQTLGGTSLASDQGYPVDVALRDGVTPVISGTFEGRIELPTSADDSVTLESSGATDGFVAAFNADDTYFAWAQSAGGTPVNSISTLALRSDGAPIVAGGFGGTMYFPTGRAAPDDSIAVTAQGTQAGFVAQMNADDSYFAWVQTAGGAGYDYVQDIAVNSFDEPIVGFAAGDAIDFPSGPAPDDSIAVPWPTADHVVVAGMNADDSYFTWVLPAGGGASDYAYPYSIALRDNCSPVLTGGFGAVASFPTSADDSITLESASGYDAFVAMLEPPGCRVAPDPSPVPPTPVPASAPRDVSAVAGDGSAVVSWVAPASSGSYAVSNYQVTSSPGGRTCLTSSLSCTVSGLSNGTVYTFTVKALTGAGWSVASQPSNAVTPVAELKPTVAITGAREGRRIEVSGSTTGMGMGAVLVPWVKLSGQSDFAAGSRQILVGMDGTFTWGRRTTKSAEVYVQTSDGSVRSNITKIPAKSVLLL